MSATNMRVVGLMSGTSHDAIDAAAVDLTIDGDTMRVRPLGLISVPYDPALRSAVVAAMPPATTTIEAICKLDTAIGHAFAAVAERAINEIGDGAVDVVVSHGQTMFHWVEDGAVRGTLQLGQPAWIAERTGATVVADVRSRDVAAGGQGAPLVSLVDALWLHGRNAAAVNLGGIANATLVRPGIDPIAFDSGPANALIDAAMVAASNGAATFDRDGATAAAGSVHLPLLDALLAEPYYALTAPKSTGKELFHSGYLTEHLRHFPDVRHEDVVATLTQLTARTVADAVRGVDEVILSGGGTRNPVLVAMIRQHLPDAMVRISDELGFPSDAKEAIAFAVLGALTVTGLPATLPSCTGAAHASILGNITPGLRPVPHLTTTMPTHLTIERHP